MFEHLCLCACGCLSIGSYVNEYICGHVFGVCVSLEGVTGLMTARAVALSSGTSSCQRSPPGLPPLFRD